MALCGKASVNSVTLYHPLPYSRRAAPSKEDGRTLERGTNIYPAPTRDDAVMSDQWNTSPPSLSALCSHPRRYATIPRAAAPSPTLWEPETTKTSPRLLLCILRPSVSLTLEPAYRR
jgi:hypothetical protein